MIKAIIVEDEKNSRDLLKTAIENFTTGVEIIGEANNAASTVDLINTFQFDVLFLGIDLPDGKSFDILDKLEEDYKVIFVSANNDHAIKAIRYSAFDYLLKPLDLDDLVASIERLKSILLLDNLNNGILHDKPKYDNNSENRIMVHNHSGSTFLDVDKIISVEADANYVFFMLEDGRRHLAAHSLNYYEDLLPTNKFYRIHKSHIINFTKVKSVESGRTGKAILSNGTILDIAARRKTAFISFLKRWNHSK